MSNEADDRSETESGLPQEETQSLVPSGEVTVADDGVADQGIDDASVAAEHVAAEDPVADDAVEEADDLAQEPVADDAAEDAVADDGVADPVPAVEGDVVVEDDLSAEPVDDPVSVDDPEPGDDLAAAEDVDATEVLSLDSSEPVPAEADAVAEVAAEPDPVGDDSTEPAHVPDFVLVGANGGAGESQSEPVHTEVLAAAPISGEGGTAVLPLPPPAAEASPTKPKKRSRTVMIAVISVLAVLAALIVGDRIANAAAQNSLAEGLQQELAIPDKPVVSIGGFPYATQALAGSFSSIRISAEKVPVHTDVANLTVAKLDAKLTGITVTDRYANIMANRGEATALVDWEEASKLAGQPVTYVADNQMQIDFTIPIGQLSIKGAIRGRPELNAENQTISITEPTFSLSNMDVPQPIADAVSKIALQPFPIRGLPYDIKITALTIQPEGISVSGSGANIPIRQQQ